MPYTSDFSLFTWRHFADGIFDTTCLCVFGFSQFVLPTVDSFLFFPPLPLILYSPRLSPFVNCFRLTDWWMNRSIDLMHMYKICVYIFIGAAASSSFLPPIFLFSFARNYIFCFWFRLQTSMQPPLEREEKSNKTADRSGFTWEKDSKRVGKMASRDVDADVRCVVVVRARFFPRVKKKRGRDRESRKARAWRRSRAGSWRMSHDRRPRLRDVCLRRVLLRDASFSDWKKKKQNEQTQHWRLSEGFFEQRFSLFCISQNFGKHFVDDENPSPFAILVL